MTYVRACFFSAWPNAENGLCVGFVQGELGSTGYDSAGQNSCST